MIRVIDLFAGIGGIRLGFEMVFNDLKCVFSSEIDKYAIITYKSNFLDSNINGDITQIKASDIPDHDILLAGFPCQPFSQAGKKKGFLDDRGGLFFDIDRILKKKKPKVFLLENVKQLKNHDNGKTLNTILEHLKKAGYDNIQYEILKAKDFGVPQNRERIYIIGFLDSDINFKFPKGINVPTCVGDILEDSVDSRYTISDKLWEGHRRRKIMNKKNGKGFGYSLFNKNSIYTNTISARYYKDGSEILIEQNNQNPRKIIPREAARLQGFPESFKIPVSDVQAYKQFGNSVCVPVIKAIANNIRESLNQ
ncbi:MAG: DNA cytosine methyltransferase [Rickettsiaceae bacterium]